MHTCNVLLIKRLNITIFTVNQIYRHLTQNNFYYQAPEDSRMSYMWYDIRSLLQPTTSFLGWCAYCLPKI
uniref:Uncharacterized protein n=1 Tax=Romanomermis culicivorax TaxID=13658 RepID=A0A915L7F2_ROMCU